VVTETIATSKSQVVARTKLPIPLTSFVGREQDVAEIKQLLGIARLVTLTGAGGSGKTRLALQIATDLSAEECFSDGIGWVELASLTNPELVPQSVAGALGVREVPDESFYDTLTRTFRYSHLLLVLDNCEHLVAATAQLCEQLLSSCPHLKILVTSREALSIGAEYVRLVPPLTIPQSELWDAVPTLLEFEAVRLFVDRAQLVKPGFSITNKNAPAIRQICARLDGMPLAIELAAARVKVLTVEQISARLEDRFALLTSGSRTALPRHQTLRAAIDWSYELLSPAERTLLCRLSVFAGGWTLEAAEAVCCGGEIEERAVLELQSHLVDKSMVTTQEQHGAARYHLLETIRVYAWDKLLGSGEAKTFQEQHLDYFLKLAEETKGRTQDWFYQERLLKDGYSMELDNFRAALAWSLGGEAVEKGVRLAAELFWFWNISSFANEGNEWLHRALAKSDRVSPVVQAKALFVAVYTHQHSGKYDDAIAYGEECVRICRQVGERHQVADALRALARALSNQGNQARASEMVEESIRLYRAEGCELELVDSLSILAATRQMIDDYEGSVPILEENLALARKLDDEDGIYLALAMFARVHLMRGEFAQATSLYNQYFLNNWKTGWIFRLAYGLEFNAILATLQKQTDRAARLWGAAHALRKVSGIPRPALHERQYGEYEEIASSQLDEQAYARLYAEGEAMPLEEAVKYALSAPIPAAEPSPPSSKQRRPAKELMNGLTAREFQIAGFVAEGKTSKQIAEELVLSERTVENHIGNILSKLGFHSRTQIATWFVENGIPESHS
jgi:non-specific serine/threonine protein kinase